MAKACARADIVITTAKLFGRKAPVILDEEVLAQMQPGSIVIDFAVESGGKVVGSKVGEEVTTANPSPFPTLFAFNLFRNRQRNAM